MLKFKARIPQKIESAIERGIVMCPEIAKTGLIRVPLAWLIAKSYSFEGLGVVQEVFSGGIRPRNAV